MRLVSGQDRSQIVSDRSIETGLAATAGVAVLTDEHNVIENANEISGRGLDAEVHIGEKVALIEAVEVHLENAADMRFVVGVVIEGDAVDLDGAVVSGGVSLGWWSQPDQAQDHHPDDRHSQQPASLDASNRIPHWSLPFVVPRRGGSTTHPVVTGISAGRPFGGLSDSELTL
jgi:hypothetical protein